MPIQVGFAAAASVRSPVLKLYASTTSSPSFGRGAAASGLDAAKMGASCGEFRVTLLMFASARMLELRASDSVATTMYVCEVNRGTHGRVRTSNFRVWLSC